MLPDVIPRLKPGLGGHCAEAHARTTPCPLGQRRAEPALQGGFTLVEVLVALTIAALVVLLAHQVFASVAERGRTLIAARDSLDRAANARRWLKATFLSLDVGTDSAGGFDGRADRVDFSAWQRTADGWFERRRVTLGRLGDRLVASLASGESIGLARDVADVAFDYLLEPGAESRWVREWVSPVSAPVAVRVRVTRGRATGNGGRLVTDTLLFLVKERG